MTSFSGYCRIVLVHIGRGDVLMKVASTFLPKQLFFFFGQANLVLMLMLDGSSSLWPSLEYRAA